MNQTTDQQILNQYEGTIHAPEFPAGLAWLNTAHPLSLRTLHGKIVLLDFWTYCCINCLHVLPELKKLEQKYADQLVVIGVHSAKFTTEKDTDNIRQAILRYEIEHPVVNDCDMEIWQQYAVRAWPSLLLLNPKGRIIGEHRGEMTADLFTSLIDELITYFRAKGELDETPLTTRLEKTLVPRGLLRYPGKVLADEPGNRLFISDSGHHRIIITSSDGVVQDVIGAGTAGTQDGSFAEARFNHPQGLALDGNTLYICDTDNHLIRKAELVSRTVTTFVGTGEQARHFNMDGSGREVSLNSPWDAVIHNRTLYVAMAGPHQIWAIDLDTSEAVPYAGSGYENHKDGSLRSAALAQPSGITTDGRNLFFADSEISSIRAATLPPGNQVSTLVGEGLFDYGDIDGPASVARLQHPLGVAYLNGHLYVADTYNHKIKVLDVAQREIRTFAGTGRSGTSDGELSNAQFSEPGGLTATSNALYVADTNNHLIRRIDLTKGEVATLSLQGLEKLAAQAMRKFNGRMIELPPQSIAPGAGVLSIAISLPEGFRFNPDAPVYLAWETSDDRIISFPTKECERRISVTELPLEIPLQTNGGVGIVTMDVVSYFCATTAEKLCLTDSVRVKVPLAASEGEGRKVAVEIPVQA